MSIYNLSFKDSKGQTIEMDQFKGKILLIVNTATKCGLASQFHALENLHQKYKDKNFEIIGFPCNQFMNQEPETNESMVETCEINYGVTFLLSEKVRVNGSNTHEIFTHLKKKANSGFLGNRIKWNFTKFLISKDGKSVKRYSPTKSPKQLEQDIEALLN